MSVQLNVEPVAEGVWTASADDYRTIFAAGPDGVLAVNGFGTPELAGAYAEAIVATVPGATIAATVASIDHLDHSGQASTVAGEGEIIAHELCGRVLERRDGRQVTRRAGDEERLDVGGMEVSLLHPGPSQGTGNLAVHLPEQRVLFLVGPRADARYGLMSDMHFRHLTRVWRELAELDVDVVVPGRGPLMDRAGLRRAADYVDALAKASQQAFADGVPIWIVEAIGPYVAAQLSERFGDLDGFESNIGIASIRIVHFYLMGGWGLEDTGHPELLLEAA